MKKIIKVAALACLLLTIGFTSANAQKFGYVNSAAVLAEMAEVKQADSNMEALQKQLQNKGQQMVKSYQTKLQELQRKEQAGELSPKQMEDEGKKLQEEERKIATFEQDMVKQINEKRNSLLQPIFDRVNTAIKSVATENGYQYIFDTNASAGSIILYADESNDVTTLVKSKLGM